MLVLALWATSYSIGNTLRSSRCGRWHKEDFLFWSWAAAASSEVIIDAGGRPRTPSHRITNRIGLSKILLLVFMARLHENAFMLSVYAMIVIQCATHHLQTTYHVAPQISTESLM